MTDQPEGELIDLWDVPLTSVSNPEHLKRIKGFIPFTRTATNDVS